MISITAIVPVYNEAGSLASAVRRIHRFLAPRFGHSFEILIIESGSTDGTDAIADDLAGELSEVRVYHEGQRNGFGSAVRLGYAAAKMDWVWLITPDFPFPLEALDQAIKLTSDHDAILSYRAQDNRGRLRQMQSWVFNTLVRWLFDLRVRSVNSAFKVLRRDFLLQAPFRSNGWLIDVEVAHRIQTQGVRYCEIPVPLTENRQGGSKVGALTFVRVILDLIQLRYRISKGVTRR
jgi:glycosyltransferase involved in cell wall biosynthesis